MKDQIVDGIVSKFQANTVPQFYEISFFDFVFMYIYFYHHDLVRLQVTVPGTSLTKNWKLKEVAYHTKCYLVFLQLKELSRHYLVVCLSICTWAR